MKHPYGVMVSETTIDCVGKNTINMKTTEHDVFGSKGGWYKAETLCII